MTWLFALLSSIWKPIAAIGSGLAVILFQRWRISRQQATIEKQDQAIRVHEAKEKSHENDQTVDAGTDAAIARVRHEVDHASDPAEAAGAVSEGLNDYFK